MPRRMKPSGVEWIGDMPEGWSIGRAGYYFSIQLGKMLCSIQSSPSQTLEQYYCAANVHYGNVSECGLKEMWFSPQEKHDNNVCAGDMLVVEGGAGAGGCAIVKSISAPTFMQNSILRVRTRGRADITYFCYWLESLGKAGYINFICDKATFPHFTKEKLSAVPLPLPPLAEQERIAAYLDAECGRIDRLAGDIRTELERLEEYRKSLISEAVTKGLDPKAKMKDSGVEWIGEVPEWWKSKRLKYVADVKTGPFGTQLNANEYVDDGIPCLNVKNIGEGFVRLDDVDRLPIAVVERLREHKLESGDLIFGRKGSVDKHAIIQPFQAGWLQGSDCIRVRLKDCNNQFISYYLRSSIIVNVLLRNAKGSTMPSMSAEILESLTLLLPPLAEQKRIAAFLDRKCAEIDALATARRAQLEKLEEYRKSLVFECVTGKREVPA